MAGDKHSSADKQQAGGQKRKQPLLPFARLVVGDELGLLKVVEVPSAPATQDGGPPAPAWGSTAIVQVWGQPDKQHGVQALAVPSYVPAAQGAAAVPYDDVVAVSRASGAVHLLSAEDGRLLHEVRLKPPPAAAGAAQAPQPASTASAGRSVVKGLAFQQRPGRPLGLVACTSSGLLGVLQQQQGEEGAAAATWAAAAQPTQTAPNVGCLALDPDAHQYAALGGDGHQLQVWDLDVGQEVFRAKGAKPNKVGNVDLPHLTALAFLPHMAQGPAAAGAAPAAAAAGSPSQLVLAGTVKHKLWLYDLRAGKRPQLDLAWGDARITGLAAEPGGARVWVANGAGQVEALELRAQRMQGAIKGAAGSVRCLALHPEHGAAQPWMALAGLDRFARVSHTGTRQAACKVYCKQQLTAVAWLNPALASGAAQGADAAPPQEQQHTDGQAGAGAGVKPNKKKAKTAAAAAAGKT